MFKVGLICGGPSPERGISLNSARSVMDHLSSAVLEIVPFYVDQQKRFYKISPGQLYSNTPSDFDFKLASEALVDLRAAFAQVDIIFPAIHGSFGEDGELQDLLQNLGVPFVGPTAANCRALFFKHKAKETLAANGFNSWPALVLGPDVKREDVAAFWHKHSLKRAVIKPVSGGSSIAVFSVESIAEVLEKTEQVFKVADLALLEPFCTGVEFTIIVMQGEALIPTEIEMSYEKGEIFDFRRKYLPTSSAMYHTPPRFSLETIQHIRSEAARLFALLEIQDFARFDGWLMPDGSIYFTDLNPLSGLEQNSFFFRQSALLGLTHREALLKVLRGACQRYGLELPEEERDRTDKEPVFVLFGGKTAERQVSLMSGTNVWLKLMRSQRFCPFPHFIDEEGVVWRLPYSYNLNHTVEEIRHNCLLADQHKAKIAALFNAEAHENPIRMSLDEFLQEAKAQKAFVFLALHGGEGENGTIQEKIERYGIPYNGSGPAASALCMDKWQTGKVIAALHHSHITSLSKIVTKDFTESWSAIIQELGSARVIVKPRADGCSAGIVLLQSAKDLARYKTLVHEKAPYIMAGTFSNQKGPVEMGGADEYLLEPYIEVDSLWIHENKLHLQEKEGWVELTVGILEEKGHYRALSPSISIAEGAVLSVEEKFQGGTGVNVTPPPTEVISREAALKIKEYIEIAAAALGIRNYARLDIFFNRRSEKMIVIEANTLPALTPSTVLYHQGLAEEEPLKPTALLERIILSQKISFAV